jgi:prepilin-type N-terminal cleavage/methylation domain-containing protein
MFVMDAVEATDGRVARPHFRRGGFSLVELLTVIFIISLLIAILIPSLNAARNAAKKSATTSVLKSLGVGLEMFKNDNGPDFPQTNGYPPSFVHPPLTSFTDRFGAAEANEGRFPFYDEYPVVYGAHWLPAMLMGADSQGFIKRSAVPRQTPPLLPEKWYTPEAIIGKVIDRTPLYVSPENATTRKTSALPGRMPVNPDLFKNREDMSHLPVFTDAWDQAILYYAANSAGKASNMVETVHKVDNIYDKEEQGKGPPYYFHKDNEGFTGKSDSADPVSGIPGWDFSNSGGNHAIKFAGPELLAEDVIKPEFKESFAHYIVDRKIYSNLLTVKAQGKPIDPKTPLRPVNAESYLLISPGTDGKYGTNDDVSNIPPFNEE